MTSQPGKQIIAIYAFPNVSRSKDNQIMKFGQLIEYEKICIEKWNTKGDEETIPRSFSKNSILSISLDQHSEVYFYCMPSWGLSKYIEIKLQRPLVCTSYKPLSGTSLLALFSAWFLKKNISHAIFC